MEHESEVLNALNAPSTFLFDGEVLKFSKREVITVINKLNCKKAPDYDLVTDYILKELPDVGIVYLTQLFNAVLRWNFIPPQWKIAQMRMIHKAGKDPIDSKSYRSISLLPTSNLLESLILTRFMSIIENNNLIPEYQFDF